MTEPFKQWHWDANHPGMVEHPNGAYVLVSDVARMLEAASKARATTEVEVKAPELVNELWEALFNITKDAVPEELTDAVLTVIAERLLTGYSITRNPPPRTP